MSNKLNRQKLLSALETVKPGLSSQDIFEQSTHFAFIKGKVITYNDEISISCPVDGLPSTLEAAVEAEKLYKLLSKLTADDVNLDMTEKALKVTSGRAVAGIPLQSEIKLPLEAVTKYGEWHKLPDNFLKGIGYTLPTCSKNNAAPVFTCIHVNKGYMESSDNFRITRFAIAPIPVKPFLLPATSAKWLSRYSPTEIAEGKSWIHFRTNDTVFSCRVIAGDFPDVVKYFNVTGENLKLPANVADVLDRASVFSKDELGNDEVAVTLSDKRMCVSIERATGWFKEETNMQYKGDGASFTINPILLKEISSQVRSCVLGKNRVLFSGEGWEHVVALKGV